MNERPTSSFWQVRLWPVVALVVVLACGGLLSMPLDTPRGEARFFQCRNNLKILSLALHNYHDAHGSFPPAVTLGPDGKPWHSWRVLLLPYVERKDLYDRYRFDEPWDGPNNRALAEAEALPQVFFCPADDAGLRRRTTSYLAVVGDGTMWPPAGSARSDDVPDGVGRTVHVVEAADSGVPWMEPRDLSFDGMSFSVNPATGEGVRASHPGEKGWISTGPPRANVSLGDGSVRPLTAEVPAKTVRSLLLRDDGGPAEVP